MDSSEWAARQCPACNASLHYRFHCANGSIICTGCGERQSQRPPDRLADLERRVTDIEQGRQLDAQVAQMKADRLRAYGLGLIDPTVEQRIAELEAWRERGASESKGRRR